MVLSIDKNNPIYNSIFDQLPEDFPIDYDGNAEDLSVDDIVAYARVDPANVEVVDAILTEIELLNPDLALQMSKKIMAESRGRREPLTLFKPDIITTTPVLLDRADLPGTYPDVTFKGDDIFVEQGAVIEVGAVIDASGPNTSIRLIRSGNVISGQEPILCPVDMKVDAYSARAYCTGGGVSSDNYIYIDAESQVGSGAHLQGDISLESVNVSSDSRINGQDIDIINSSVAGAVHGYDLSITDSVFEEDALLTALDAQVDDAFVGEEGDINIKHATISGVTVEIGGEVKVKGSGLKPR
jgi:hypothetical protein